MARRPIVIRLQRPSDNRNSIPVSDRLRGSALAVVSSSGQVVPFASVLAALANVPGLRLRVLRHDDGHGAALEHVGPLVTQAAHETLWPQIVDWLYAADPGPWPEG